MANIFYGLAAISIAAGLFFIGRGFGEQANLAWPAWQTGISAVVGGAIFGAIAYGITLLERLVLNTRPQPLPAQTSPSFHEELRLPVIALRSLAETSGSASSSQYAAIVSFIQSANGAEYSEQQKSDLSRWTASLPGDEATLTQAITAIPGLSSRAKAAMGHAIKKVTATNTLRPDTDTSEAAMKAALLAALEESPTARFQQTQL